MKNLLLLLALSGLLTGCAGIQGYQTKGGVSSSGVSPNGEATASLKQSDNPQAASKQTQEVKRTESFVLPAGSKVIERQTSEVKGKPVVTERVFEVSKETPVNTETVSKTGTELGPAQKNKAAEVAAKIKAMRPLQFAGFFLIVAAAACFTPWATIITGGSKTFPIILGAAGLVLCLAPAIIPGYEGIILAFGLGVPTIWFIAHRHGEHKSSAIASVEAPKTDV